MVTQHAQKRSSTRFTTSRDFSPVTNTRVSRVRFGPCIWSHSYNGIQTWPTSRISAVVVTPQLIDVLAHDLALSFVHPEQPDLLAQARPYASENQPVTYTVVCDRDSIRWKAVDLLQRVVGLPANVLAGSGDHRRSVPSRNRIQPPGLALARSRRRSTGSSAPSSRGETPRPSRPRSRRSASSRSATGQTPLLKQRRSLAELHKRAEGVRHLYLNNGVHSRSSTS